MSLTPTTLIHFVDSNDFGGTEQMLLTLVEELDRRRWRPILVHHPEPGTARLVDKARRLGVETRAVPRMRGRRGLAEAMRFARMLRDERPTLFHAHLNWPLACSWGLLAARWARVPAIVATQQLFADLSTRGLVSHKLLSCVIDRYIAVSSDMAENLRAACLCADGKVEMIHNATKVNRSGPRARVELRAAWGATDRPMVLSIARLDRQKGLSYLLAAAPRLPEAILVLAGEGTERVHLQAQARALGVSDRVIFLGYQDNVPALLEACDLVVLPSLYEGLPVAALEAMAAGKPVVATAIAGTEEAVVHGETGFLVPPRDPAALARAMRIVLGDQALAKALGAAGRARVEERFSADAMARRVTQIYDELLGKRERPGRH